MLIETVLNRPCTFWDVGRPFKVGMSNAKRRLQPTESKITAPFRFQCPF